MKRLVLCQFLMAFNVLKKGPRPSGTCRAQSRCVRTSAVHRISNRLSRLSLQCVPSRVSAAADRDSIPSE